MSPAAQGAAAAAATPAISPQPSPTRPVPHHELPHRQLQTPLSVVRTQPGPARTPFVILIAGLVVGGLVALLLLNTALTQGAFERKAVSRELKHLLETQAGLRQQIAKAEEPATLAASAGRLGLVASTCPVFLRLPKMTVLGTPCPAKAAPKPVAKPTQQVAPGGQTAVPGAPTTGVPGTPGTPVPGTPAAGGKPIVTPVGPTVRTPTTGTPPGKTPPGKTPPGKTPPGKTPPGKTPTTIVPPKTGGAPTPIKPAPAPTAKAPR